MSGAAPVPGAARVPAPGTASTRPGTVPSAATRPLNDVTGPAVERTHVRRPWMPVNPDRDPHKPARRGPVPRAHHRAVQAVLHILACPHLEDARRRVAEPQPPAVV